MPLRVVGNWRLALRSSSMMSKYVLMCSWSFKYFACFSMLLYEVVEQADKVVDTAEQDEERVRAVWMVDVVDAIADLIKCELRDCARVLGAVDIE